MSMSDFDSSKLYIIAKDDIKYKGLGINRDLYNKFNFTSSKIDLQVHRMIQDIISGKYNDQISDDDDSSISVPLHFKLYPKEDVSLVEFEAQYYPHLVNLIEPHLQSRYKMLVELTFVAKVRRDFILTVHTKVPMDIARNIKNNTIPPTPPNNSAKIAQLQENVKRLELVIASLITRVEDHPGYKEAMERFEKARIGLVKDAYGVGDDSIEINDEFI